MLTLGDLSGTTEARRDNDHESAAETPTSQPNGRSNRPSWIYPFTVNDAPDRGGNC